MTSRLLGQRRPHKNPKNFDKLLESVESDITDSRPQVE